MCSARNNRPNFFETSAVNHWFDRIESIFARHNNDVADTIGPLKCLDRMRDDRSAGDRCKKFVETHAATVTSGNDDGGQHGRHDEPLKSWRVEAGNAILTL